jgi:hypothetical protein
LCEHRNEFQYIIIMLEQVLKKWREVEKSFNKCHIVGNIYFSSDYICEGERLGCASGVSSFVKRDFAHNVDYHARIAIRLGSGWAW